MPYSADPKRFDELSVWIGDTLHSGDIILQDAAGVAYSLAGASGECVVLSEPGGDTLLSPTVTISGPSTGTFYFSDTAANTADLAPQTGQFFIRLTFGDGTKRTILYGKIEIRRGGW